MNFADAARGQTKYTRTENGALALNTTGSACLDFFSQIGALRGAEETRITRLFADAYRENPLMAVKIAFYGRDVRGGLGEREVFRTLLKHMATYNPEVLLRNLELISHYGRYDDLYALVGTSLEDEMWLAMKEQFERDVQALEAGKPVSLLGKWIKTPDASSEKTRRLGILTAEKLGYNVPEFKRILRKLRRAARVVEQKMSAREWSEIDYPSVPSRAMHIYDDAFKRHDEQRFNSFINKAVKGEVKINSSTLYPYDIVHKILAYGWGKWIADEDTVAEAQWRALPNYVEGGANAMVIADTSGSMDGRPIEVAISLAIYFAERNTGAYHNLWMTFSKTSRINTLRGNTLAQKINSMNFSGWGCNTNVEAAFNQILNIAVENNVSQDEMPKSLIIISDMQFDPYVSGDWLFYNEMAARFMRYGYTIPNVVFWNVNSSRDTFHADKDRKGVQLVSGSSAVTFKHVLETIGFNPVEAMEKVINGERYSPIKI